MQLLDVSFVLGANGAGQILVIHPRFYCSVFESNGSQCNSCVYFFSFYFQSKLGASTSFNTAAELKEANPSFHFMHREKHAVFVLPTVIAKQSLSPCFPSCVEGGICDSFSTGRAASPHCARLENVKEGKL